MNLLTSLKIFIILRFFDISTSLYLFSLASKEENIIAQVINLNPLLMIPLSALACFILYLISSYAEANPEKCKLKPVRLTFILVNLFGLIVIAHNLSIILSWSLT